MSNSPLPLNPAFSPDFEITWTEMPQEYRPKVSFYDRAISQFENRRIQYLSDNAFKNIQTGIKYFFVFLSICAVVSAVFICLAYFLAQWSLAHCAIISVILGTLSASAILAIKIIYSRCS